MRPHFAAPGVHQSRSHHRGMDQAFYFVRAGQSEGPVSGFGLVELVLQGVLKENALVWRNGMEKWAALCAVPELAQAVAAVEAAQPGASCSALRNCWSCSVPALPSRLNSTSRSDPICACSRQAAAAGRLGGAAAARSAGRGSSLGRSSG